MLLLPPVLNYGSPELQAQVVPDVLSGKKFIALAITEAFAGSDVSGIQTTAVRDGDYWVITGTKKSVFIPHIFGSLTKLAQVDNKWNFRRLLHNWLQNRSEI